MSGIQGVGYYKFGMLSFNNPFLTYLLQTYQKLTGAFATAHGVYPWDFILSPATNINTPGVAPSMDIGIQ